MNTNTQVREVQEFTTISVPVRRMLRSTLVHNVVSLYGTQIAAYVFPLMTLPYLARVLGVHHWGLVAFAQAFGAYAGLVVEFGFNLSATRDVARSRDDREQLSKIVAGVLGAKLMLVGIVLMGACVLQFWLRQFRAYPLLLWAGTLAGVAQAFSMSWFYQGLERMRTAATLDITAKAIASFGVFLFVHAPQHAWRVLVIQAVGYMLGTSVLLWMAYREVAFRRPTLHASWMAMRSGASMFLFRSAVSLYTSMNTLLVGILAGPVAVGNFAGAEKACRAVVALQQPLSQALYPRLSFLRVRNKQRAEHAAKIGTLLLLGCGVICSTALFVATPLIIGLLLGPRYSGSVPIMRVLAFLPIGVALACAIAYQWMLPLGLDRQMTFAAMLGGICCVIIGSSLYHFFGPPGMAVGTVMAEFLVSAYYLFALRARRARVAILEPVADS